MHGDPRPSCRSRMILFVLRFLYALANFTGYASYVLMPVKRRIMLGELKKIMDGASEPELRKAAQRSFVEFYKKIAENSLYGFLSKDVIDAMVTVEGLHHVDESLKKGRGVVILLSHFGSHLLPLPALAYRGYLVHQLTGPQLFKRGGFLSRAIFKIRKKSYANLPLTFLESNNSLKSALQALRNNEMIAIAIDGRVGKKWLTARMFGRDAKLSPGPIRIAASSGAIILPTFIVRKQDNTHRIIIENPLVLEYNPDENVMLQATMQSLASTFERYLKEFPSHYGMVLTIMMQRVRLGLIEYSLLP